MPEMLTHSNRYEDFMDWIADLEFYHDVTPAQVNYDKHDVIEALVDGEVVGYWVRDEGHGFIWKE